MPERTPETLLQRGVNAEAAYSLIDTLERRFGKGHRYLAYHAAFPLVLTPDLLYYLWINFARDGQGEQLNIPWIAVADLLLSNLCQEIGYELYEINIAVRNELLRELEADPRFGRKRIEQLSDFLLAYFRDQLRSSDPYVRDTARLQRWNALAYTAPQLAASELAQALRIALEEDNKTEQVRLASLIETCSEPLTSYMPLLTYARHVAYFAHGYSIDSQAQSLVRVAVEQIKRELEVHLPTLDQIRKGSIATGPQLILYELPQPPKESERVETTPEPLVSESSQPGQNAIQPTRSWYDLKPGTVRSRIVPVNRCTCPSCFTEIALAECDIVSSVTPGQVLERPRNWWRNVLSLRPKRLDGEQYAREKARRRCPICSYLLPYNIELVPNTTLAVIGDTASGKTHYITALIHQIKTELLREPDSALICLTPEVEQIYIKRYFEPLFARKEILPSTPRETNKYATPLIYTLTLGPTEVTNLLFYDAAGEDFAQEARIVQAARFIFNASAFIFVTDPIRMEPVFESLPYPVQEELQGLHKAYGYRRPVDVINTTTFLYDRFKGYSSVDLKANRLPPRPPVAMMISKADLLQYSMPDASFMQKASYEQGLDLQEVEIIDQEVKKMLRTYEQGDLLTATRHFGRRKFFATSATGGPADASGHYKFVEPNRCLDPFLWILYQLGITKTAIKGEAIN